MTKLGRANRVGYAPESFLHGDRRGKLLGPTHSNHHRNWAAADIVLTHSLHIEASGGNRTGASYTDNAEWDGLTKFCGLAWIKNDGSGTQWFLGKPANAGVSFRIGFVTTGQDIAFVTAAGTLSLTDNLFVSGIWNLLGWSYDGTQGTTNNRVKAWCQNVEFTTKSGSCSTSIATSSSLLVMGGNSSGTTTPDYHICHVPLWLGRTMSAAEYAEHWNGGVPVDARSTSMGQPTHYYQLQNDLVDTGSNPINGTGLNSPAFTSAVPP